MDTAPMNRDVQIELMVFAKDRHAASAARWIASSQVTDMVRAMPSPVSKDTTSYLRNDVRVARCG